MSRSVLHAFPAGLSVWMVSDMGELEAADAYAASVIGSAAVLGGIV